MDRLIRIDVVDKNDLPIPNATISVQLNGTPIYDVTTGQATTTVQLTDPAAVVGLKVRFKRHNDEVLLAQDAQYYKFRIPITMSLPNQPSFFEKHFPAVIGLPILIISIGLGFAFSNQNPLQQHITLACLAIGLSGVGSEIPGMLDVKMTVQTTVKIWATGALAIFVILYFFAPKL